MTIDELKKALECHLDGECNECPIDPSGNCIREIARAALDFINAKGQPLDQRQMALKTIMMALDKGGYRYIVGIVGRKFKFCPLCGARMDGDGDAR